MAIVMLHPVLCPMWKQTKALQRPLIPTNLLLTKNPVPNSRNHNTSFHILRTPLMSKSIVVFQSASRVTHGA
ncbi:unnamed protein product [Hymenolepis diminuta]|uniref:Uncharacterized protein n=1 Tax=Hymenolepis diminuta TaxID=6216 RepID=A0A564ZDM7_HYMDI|nr:unnamed protein product [Hymenolepis diminuta]